MAFLDGFKKNQKALKTYTQDEVDQKIYQALEHYKRFEQFDYDALWSEPAQEGGFTRLLPIINAVATMVVLLVILFKK